MTASDLSSLPKCANINSMRASRFSLELKSLIGSMIRKPGGVRAISVSSQFPTTTFRRAYDALAAPPWQPGGRRVRTRALFGHSQALVRPEVLVVPTCTLTPPDLSVYDACLEALGGGL
jgi:hypothetical protein